MITLLDVNDNIPFFRNVPTTLTVSEVWFEITKSVSKKSNAIFLYVLNYVQSFVKLIKKIAPFTCKCEGKIGVFV